MARMYPSKLTEAFSGFNVPAERSLYEKLSRELPDDYHVFHDVVWDDPSLDDSKKAGQIDFVIVHPHYGLIALEVKGGRCSYDPDFRAWTSMDRDDNRMEISDPFDQAKTASRVLMKLLRSRPRLDDMFIPHHYAAAFPDCAFGARDLRGDVLSWQVVDQDGLYDLKTTIHRLFEKSFPSGKIAGDGGKLILQGVKEIYGDRALSGKVLAAQRVRAISDKLIRLTEDQLGILEVLREHKRLVIRGCAGSGKTTLAVHKARMLSEEGKRVLLVCFNQPLGWHLGSECEGFENITVGHFNGFCFDWLTEIGKTVKPVDTDQWWSVTFPNSVADEIDAIPHRFDAIIVDEGQDFKEAYWLLLEMFLADPERGVFYIFADASQNIYQGNAELPMISAPVNLNRNLRNTNQVFDLVRRTCELTDAIKPSGVDGPKVEFVEYSNEKAMINEIGSVLGRLISEQLTPDDVVILGTKSQRRTVLKYGTKIGPFLLVEQIEARNELVTMTVHRFKGLESPVVILCELDGDLKYNLKEILYIGMTRATSMLFIMTHSKTLDSQLVLSETEVNKKANSQQ